MHDVNPIHAGSIHACICWQFIAQYMSYFDPRSLDFFVVEVQYRLKLVVSLV